MAGTRHRKSRSRCYCTGSATYERLSLHLSCATFSPVLFCISFRLTQCFALRLPPLSFVAMPSSRPGHASLGVRAKDLMTHEQWLVMLGLAPAASPPLVAASAAPPLVCGALRKSPPAVAAKAAHCSPAYPPADPHFSKASSMPTGPRSHHGTTIRRASHQVGSARELL